MSVGSRVRRFLLLAVLAGVGSPVLVHTQPSPPSPLAVEIDAILQRARNNGVQFQTSNDRKARDQARKDLDEAEKLVRSELRKDKNCEVCVTGQVAVYFFRSAFNIDNQYDECLKAADEGLERFPQNAKLALYKGYAHYNKNQPREAAAALRRFTMLAPTDPMAPQAKTLADNAQTTFLGAWYGQANFYNSNDSRITNYNTQTARNEVIFQVTPEFELSQIGAPGFASLSREGPPANDGETVAYLQQLVNRIVEKTPGPSFRYDVTLIESPAVNAVTPPGHIVVFTGLLRFTDSEGQLAGVLAHEIAHNYAHHAARRMIKAYLGQNIAANLIRTINPQGAVNQSIAQLTASLGLGLILNAYSRFEEQEADLYGLHLLFNAGYNPTAMPSMFLKLYQENPRQPIKFLSTHPPHPDRVNYLTDYLESFPLDREMIVDSSAAFTRMKQKYPSAVVGTAGGGLVPGAGVAPTTPTTPAVPAVPAAPVAPGGPAPQAASAAQGCRGTSYAVSVTPDVARQGQPLTVQALAPNGQFPPQSWIGLFPEGGAGHLGQWAYFDQLRTCGVHPFNAPGPGRYEIRILLDSGYDKIAARGTFTVQ